MTTVKQQSAWKAARGLAAARIAGGAALLTAPARAAEAVARGGGVVPSWLIRLLAARWVAQGAVEVRRPTRDVLAAGATIDVLHAASMLLAVDSRYRRSALFSAALAALTAAGSYWTAHELGKANS